MPNEFKLLEPIKDPHEHVVLHRSSRVKLDSQRDDREGWPSRSAQQIADENFDSMNFAPLRARRLRTAAFCSQLIQLIARIYDDIAELEQKAGSRVRKRRARSGAKFLHAVERFVGDLLRVKGGTTGPALLYRPVGKSSFTRDPVKYDVFMGVLDGLKELELVGHRKGQTHYRKADFGPGNVIPVTMLGRAARFWATAKLLKLAEHYGIHSGNIGQHFAPEPPTNPLVLKDYATGRGRNKERGKVVKYPRTPETERLEADIRELNEFVATFDLTGAKHDGYTRIFNNLSWKAGGRLYGDGAGNYQQMPEAKRHKMTINGEPVAEIDIKASHPDNLPCDGRRAA